VVKKFYSKKWPTIFLFLYAMSEFQIPMSVCKRMMDAISQFWWGDDANSNKMHWYAL
jgi:hypothetical protein